MSPHRPPSAATARRAGRRPAGLNSPSMRYLSTLFDQKIKFIFTRFDTFIALKSAEFETIIENFNLDTHPDEGK
ncbi:MAG: hypothetical protein IOC52_05805 [Methylobacterium sp.]|nr:hypothetical protein [Methylobacterium sp.]MCA3627751.1 hypothetical protein [Methylobacterium sp.]